MELKSDALSESLLHALPFGFDVVDEDGTILFLSERQERLLGRDAVGSKCWEVYRDDCTQCEDCPLRGGIDQGATATLKSEGVLGGKTFEIHHTGLIYEGRPAVLEIFEEITGRHRAEEALKTNEARLRLLVNQMPAVLWTTDRDLLFTSSVGAGLKRLKLEPDQVVGQTLFQYFNTEDRNFLPIVMHRRALEGQTGTYEITWDDNVYEAHVEPLRDATGAITGCIGIALDVTERSHAERMLQLTQFAVERAGDPMFWLKSDGTFFYVNQVACRRLGYSRGELLSKTVFDIDPEFTPALWPSHWASLKQHGTLKFTSQHRAKGGKTFPVEIVANYIEFEGQEYNVALARDMTEREQAAQALRQSEANLRRLFEHATHGMYRSTPDGRFLAVNPAMIQMLGYESEEQLLAVDMARDIYVDPDERQRLVEQHESAQRIEDVEVQWKRRDGQPIMVRLSGRPVHNDAGEMESFEMIAEDITDRRKLEAQLRQAQKMEAIGQLTGGIAHDFNNELSVILLNAQLVGSALQLGQEVQVSDIHDVEDAARRAATMTKQLLGFSRHADLTIVPSDLARVVSNLTSILRRLLPENIDIRIAADEPVSSVEADASAVEQMLLNLATNSRDAMHNGGELRIDVEERVLDRAYCAIHPSLTPGPYVCVSVSDTGVGMDEETQARIFEPFFTTKTPGIGTGLGMAMVYGLTKQQGGYVNVESEVGKGTTVRLHFPTVAEEAHGLPTRESAEQIRGGAETILLVEDEDALRRTGKRVLEKFGYTVLLAANGEEALEVYRTHASEIDLVVSDLVMPKMSGPQLYRRLREEAPNLRFILASGYSGRETEERKALEPAVPFVQKPWKLTNLLVRVRLVLDRKSDN